MDAIGPSKGSTADCPQEKNERGTRERIPENKPQDYEVKIVPEGTFAGHIDKPELVIKGEVVPEDTGDQGGGQN